MTGTGNNALVGWCADSPSGPRVPDLPDGGPVVAHAVPVRRVLPVLLIAALVTGCSGSDGDCAGQAYHASADAKGAATPIEALEVWLGDPKGFDQPPPDEGWVVQDSGEDDADTVVLTNEAGHGWWVSAIRTTDGGYVVDQATDDATDCQDELS